MQRILKRNKKPPHSREFRKPVAKTSLPEVGVVPVRIIVHQQFVEKHDLEDVRDGTLWHLACSIVIGLRRFAKKTNQTLNSVSIHTANGRKSVRCNWNDFKLAVSTILQKLYGLIPQSV